MRFVDSRKRRQQQQVAPQLPQLDSKCTLFTAPHSMPAATMHRPPAPRSGRHVDVALVAMPLGAANVIQEALAKAAALAEREAEAAEAAAAAAAHRASEARRKATALKAQFCHVRRSQARWGIREAVRGDDSTRAADAAKVSTRGLALEWLSHAEAAEEERTAKAAMHV